MVLLSAQGLDASAIAKVAFTSEDQVHDVTRNLNADGFASLYRPIVFAARVSGPWDQSLRAGKFFLSGSNSARYASLNYGTAPRCGAVGFRSQ
jgi:hypothetical protein